jgi:hypothetical protein
LRGEPVEKKPKRSKARPVASDEAEAEVEVAEEATPDEANEATTE